MKRCLIPVALATILLVAGICCAEPPMPPDPWEFIIDGPREGKDGRDATVHADGRGQGEGHGPESSGPPEVGSPAPAPHGPRGMSTPPCPPACLAAVLDLNDGQKKQISTVLKSAREDIVPLLKKREESLRLLRRAERAPVFDEKAVGEVARSLGRIETEMIMSRAKAHARIRDLLTPAQRDLVLRLMPWFDGAPCMPPGRGKL